NKPPWAAFDPDSGRLSGTPEDADLGTYPDIRVSVTDGQATADLAAFSVEVVATASGSATLSWTPPIEKTDGTPIDLKGYKIHWGTSPHAYSHWRRLDNPGLASYVVESLT